MKIIDLMKKFGLTRESVRYYRQKHFLMPSQLENGYFEYTVEDSALLFQLLKYKALNNGTLKGIEQYANDNQKTFELLKESSKATIEQIDNQIEQLERLKAIHQYRVDYYNTIVNEINCIQQVNDCVGLYYLPFEKMTHEQSEALLKNGRSYQSVVISKDCITKAKTSGYFHPEYCIGITERNYEAEKNYITCDIHQFHYIEKGHTGLRFVVRLEHLEQIPYEVLKPVFDYMESNHLELIAPVTSTIILATTTPKRAFYTLFRFLYRG